MKGVSRKVFVVGDSGCGKTSIIKTFCNKENRLDNLTTTLEKYVTDMEVNGRIYELNIWDALCSHHYRVDDEMVRKSIYKDTDLVIIVFDISQRKTFKNVFEKWYQEILRFCPKHTPIILVGNKKDSRNDDRLSFQKHVKYPEGLATANKIGAIAYIESSALNKKGVREIFINAARGFKKDASCVLI